MKKVILSLVACLATFSNLSFADNITFSGTLANACTISGVTSGVLNIAGSGISTSAPAGATVVNNAGGAFTLDLADPTDWDSAPGGYAGTTTFDGGITTTGDNPQGSPVNSIPLTNLGTDTVSVTLSGTSTTVYPAGSYSATAVLSCNAV